jgi:hypothetical protein
MILKVPQNIKFMGICTSGGIWKDVQLHDVKFHKNNFTVKPS